MAKKVSLKDIAEKAGVSIALVSYVLNNKKESRVSKAVAQKIRDIAGELNYRTNQIAKSLKTNKTFTIGLIVADISNPFSSAMARIIEDEADKKNYTVLFGSADENAEKSSNLMHALLDRRVDGFIIAPAENTEKQLDYLSENEIPFVLIDRYFPNMDASHVMLDNYQAAYSATDHIIQTGSKRIGMITFNTSLYNLQERKRGYIEALKKKKLKIEKKWLKEIAMDNVRLGVQQSIHELLSLPKPVDAILFSSNVLAVEGLKYFTSKKIRVPDDLAIVSFDQSDASDVFYSPLTYINQPLQEMGKLATKILLEKLDGKKEIIKINLPGELIIRQSTIKKSNFG